jgi:hypothetical protein
MGLFVDKQALYRLEPGQGYDILELEKLPLLPRGLGGLFLLLLQENFDGLQQF